MSSAFESTTLDGTTYVDTIMGLTSTISEEVNIGRDQFMSAYEDALGPGVVFQVVTDVNALLAGVNPPHNENIDGIPDGETRVSFSEVGAFEAALKVSWSDMSSDSDVALKEQMRLFLGEFFDKNKELNSIVAGDGTSAATSSITYLSMDKIVAQLTSLGAGDTYSAVSYESDGSFNFDSGKPQDSNSLATNLLSCRQVVQVLEAYAALGVGRTNSRVIRDGNAYKYKLHAGDSIIGECTIVDSDASTSASQYSQSVKVQLVQSATGAWSPGDMNEVADPAPEGTTEWNGSYNYVPEFQAWLRTDDKYFIAASDVTVIKAYPTGAISATLTTGPSSQSTPFIIDGEAVAY